MPIADVKGFERVGQGVLVVLRVGARARHGAHIGDELDLGGLQELDECGEGPGRVPDRKERAHAVYVEQRMEQSKAAVGSWDEQRVAGR